MISEQSKGYFASLHLKVNHLLQTTNVKMKTFTMQICKVIESKGTPMTTSKFGRIEQQIMVSKKG